MPTLARAQSAELALVWTALVTHPVAALAAPLTLTSPQLRAEASI